MGECGAKGGWARVAVMDGAGALVLGFPADGCLAVMRAYTGPQEVLR